MSGTHTHACTHARTHARARTHTCTRTHACTHTCTRTHTCTHMHTHARTHTHTHTHAHTHTRHARTHARTHTHTTFLCMGVVNWNECLTLLTEGLTEQNVYLKMSTNSPPSEHLMLLALYSRPQLSPTIFSAPSGPTSSKPKLQREDSNHHSTQTEHH